MTSDEIIIVDNIPVDVCNQIIIQSVKYAVISIPFTFNRMDITDLTRKIANIAKGKIAEGLFRHFALTKNIPVDFNTCQTPFYQADKRDFILYGDEWDIKNNYIFHDGFTMSANDYLELPALIPDRGKWDQWSKRNEVLIPASKEVKFLFTFLKSADLKNKQKFLNIELKPEQQKFLDELYQTYKGKFQKSEPFTEDWFWNNFYKYGQGHVKFEHRPALVITGFAGNSEWKYFIESSDGINKYLNKTLVTKIKNRVATVKDLPAFVGLMRQ